MPTLFESATNAIQRFMCAATVDGSALVNWIDQAASGIGGGNLSGTPGARFGMAAGMAFRGLVCPAPTGGQSGGAGAGVTYPPVNPILGQCDGVVYVGTWLRERADGFQQLAGIPPIFGPLEDIIRDDSGSTVRARAVCRGAASGSLQPPGTLVTIASFSSAFEFESVVAINPVRQDGLPDDCGGDEPQQPPVGTDTIDYDDPDGNPVTDEPITFSPRFPVVLPGGALIIPITVTVAGLVFVANFNMGDLSIEFDFSEGEPGAESCCPPTDVPEVDDNPPESPPPPDSVLRYWGVLVRATVAAGANINEVGDGDGLTTWLPDLGWVRFAIDVGGRRGWTEKVEIQTIPQMVPVNAPAVAYGFDVHARPGVTIETFPVIVAGTDDTT
ncbi:MAG: hypothetical protein AAFZ35_23630 [Cyanobacteria bacterium J06649_12]